jgi:hypothetical protein
VKLRLLYAWLTILAVLLVPRASFAMPEAHLLRIDPRAGVQGGVPIITTVVETIEFKPMSEVVTSAGCGTVQGDAVLDCISNAVEQKNVMWKAFQFPDPGARLLVRVDGADQPAKLESKATWAQSTKDPLVGTAWLIALDASSLMASRYGDAREVANQIINALGPNDIAKLIIFDDRIAPYVANSAWVPAAQKASLIQILSANPGTQPSHQRSRPLFNQIKNITKSFGDLGNLGSVPVPMHQAMVLLSNGSGREDAASASISAEAMKQYFNKGRFPEDNPLSPKTPLPVIAIYFPNARGFTNDLYASNDMQFMEDISNPEIGGFFDIVRGGQGVVKATAILSQVKARFNNMWVVKWRLSCLATTPTQTFNLIFPTTGAQAVKPDGSFQDVPIGVDPTSWPLDINIAQTKAEADANPVRPGGKFRVFGDFCWGGDKGRAEAYFVPAGTNPNQNVNRNDPEIAKKAMQSLIAQNLHGTAEEATATSVTLTVPDEEKLLEGEGDNMITRVVIYDNKAQRASGVTAETVLTLKAGKKTLNLPMILGAAGIVVVILLLVVVLLRGGGGKGRKGGAPPPAPIVAGGPPPGYGPPGGGPPGYGGAPPPGGGYGGPPGGYGGPPGGGGYGAAPYAGAPFAPVESAPVAVVHPYVAPLPAPPPHVPPEPSTTPSAYTPKGGGYPLAGAGNAPIEVRCPACGMATMAMPGASSVCFSCGQPLPRDIGTAQIAAPPPVAVAAPPHVAASPVVASPGRPAFPLTSQLEASALAPPPNPYGPSKATSAPLGGTSASIIGAAGTFAIQSGGEVKVGRDPASCPITLTDPKVSGNHATLKFEGGQLLVRDDGSNNGTHIDGVRIPAQTWTPVSPNVRLRFGPVEFVVKID